MQRTVRLATEDDTRRFATAFSRFLRGGDVIWLVGPLGAGKTAFVRFLIHALGGQRRVPSPSFILRATYPLRGRGIVRLHHLDAFRLRRPDAAFLADVAELVADRQSVVAIEWADRLRRFLPQPTWHIDGAYTNDGGRRFTIAGDPVRLRRVSRMFSPLPLARRLLGSNAGGPRRSSLSGRGR
ncbi:MAG: tRNA (adenosine(37)-N6)-threonylcarbamoyltransferase complex ATPase subunit type 1 TsaE [Candidatus Kerfeldbacteria bacterium]|nr:tRNA (adenosine(37)-N6)-threonylcarbamoyltransferase complex ATPase subunit type 1 TsaE [Candidatus Kerfeldbacteria bacterium]